MKKNKIDITYDTYFYNIYSEIMKELAEIESNIFQDLTDIQIEYLEKIKFYFFKTGFNAAVNEVEIKKEFEKLLKEIKNK
ncbi:hypothetical protein [Fusobacterium polymorphum]|jgi:hypothetical protein|uniref:Uncharacterized protein n=1 Tax=Fusobacterium nucleatum subsp. polymorphum TaxID=76857 RepID=A0AAC8WDA4_FUSNP|nr:hypothetical protein [Fusobacterium polymorphum]ALM93196.1 hypothetical protein RO02_00765 [Fusobacterium polymorphum]MDU2234629.1 hypothetical protein [Fusobacterium periodonticum]